MVVKISLIPPPSPLLAQPPISGIYSTIPLSNTPSTLKLNKTTATTTVVYFILFYLELFSLWRNYAVDKDKSFCLSLSTMRRG